MLFIASILYLKPAIFATPLIHLGLKANPMHP